MAVVQIPKKYCFKCINAMGRLKIIVEYGNRRLEVTNTDITLSNPSKTLERIARMLEIPKYMTLDSFAK